DEEDPVPVGVELTDLPAEVGETVVEAGRAGVGIAGVVVELADLVDRDLEAFAGQGLDRLREVLPVLPARGVGGIGGGVDREEPGALLLRLGPNLIGELGVAVAV